MERVDYKWFKDTMGVLGYSANSGFVRKVKRVFDERDELLEALERYMGKFGDCGPCYDNARAAIAKAKGQEA